MQFEKRLRRDRLLLAPVNHGDGGRIIPMSAAAETGVSLACPRWVASIASLVMKLPSTICCALQRRQAIEELEALDDSTLTDIGISRGQIRSVVRRGVQHG